MLAVDSITQTMRSSQLTGLLSCSHAVGHPMEWTYRCVHACMHVCEGAYMHFVCMHVCEGAYMHFVCMRVCEGAYMRVCVHVCVHASVCRVILVI